MESKKRSKGWVPAAMALGGALVVFSGCGQANRTDSAQQGNGKSAVTAEVGTTQSGPFNDPAHPLQCKASGDSAPSTHGANSPAAIVAASILSSFSPSQVGWFGPPFAPMAANGTPTCDTTNATPSVIDTSGRDIRYNNFVFKNWTDTDACVSAYVWDDVPPVQKTQMQLAAYVGSYDPNDILSGNVAASAPADDIHLSFKVPAGAMFEVVVIGAGPLDHSEQTSLGNYHLFVSNCGQTPAAGGGGDGSSSGGSTSGGDTDAGAPPPATDDAGTGGKSW